MVSHMKTTIDISDRLLEEARRVALREGTTIRALLEQGLRTALSQRRARATFKLRRASFKGKGLQPGVRDLSWDAIRDLAYEDRGA